MSKVTLPNNPRIVFVLGGPASGKGTQCDNLKKEYGYTHISTGDLFRDEVKKGSTEGLMMKQIMTEGGLIPFELTVQVLVNALLAQPSKSYLIDGFPRAIDQAKHFEKVIGVPDAVLYFNTSEEICTARCLERAKTSGRADDTEEIIRKRLQTYNNMSKPVVDFYKKRDKVVEVDGAKDVETVWQITKNGMDGKLPRIVLPGRPKIVFVLGGPASGKGTQCDNLKKEFGYRHISTGDLFRDEVKSGSPQGEMMKKIMSEGGLIPFELTVQVLVNAMIALPARYYLIDGFPRALDQAEHFEKVIGVPDAVLYVNTSEEICTSRCLERAKTSGRVDDTEEIIRKRLQTYNNQSKPVVDFYKKKGKVVEVDGAKDVNSVWKLTKAGIEKKLPYTIEKIALPGNPKIVFVLGGPASGKGTQCDNLKKEFGYTHISTGDLFRDEVKKGSPEGEMMKKIMSEGGLIPYQLTVQVLVNALQAQPSQSYLIDGFPRALDQAHHFEKVIGVPNSVLYFNTSEEICTARCLERAKTSGRVDDTEEIIRKRLQTYNNQSKPVVDFYKKKGKVVEVDGAKDVATVWEETKTGILNAKQSVETAGSGCSGCSSCTIF